jgi:hypothetical protein
MADSVNPVNTNPANTVAASDFKARMQRHPLAPKQPATIAVPEKPQQADTPVVSPAVTPAAVDPAVTPVFELPDPNKPMTLNDMVNVTRGGDNVSVKARPMTPQEQEAVKAGKSPDVVLSEMERRNLIKAGWEEGTKPPAGFPAALQEIIADYVNQKRAEGVPFDQIRIKDIDDLPPEEQLRVRAAFASLMERERKISVSPVTELAEYPESVRNEILRIQEMAAPVTQQPVTQPVMQQPVQQPIVQQPVTHRSVTPEPVTPEPVTPQPVTPETVTPEPEVSDLQPASLGFCPTCGCNPFGEKQRLTCTHCGSDPLENPDSFEISDTDKQQFLIAIGTGKPFQKEYTVFNGTIRVVFRSLKSLGYEQLSVWAARRAAAEVLPRAESYADYLERVQYYELMGGLALQTVILKSTIAGSPLFWAAPDVPYAGLKEWKEAFGINGLDELLEKFQEVIPSESVITAMRLQLIDFNRLDYRLTREGLNTENFWKGI